jgi:hypothetical protein
MNYLSVMPFNNRADLDVLFAHSNRVLEYLTVGDSHPLFLAIITDEQKQYLENKNFKVKIIESNPDLTRYILLRHPLPDQSNKLIPYGEVTPLTRQYTLLKIPPGQEFIHEGVRGEFFDIRIDDTIVTPPFRTKTITTIPTATQIVAKSKATPQPMFLILIIVVILITLSILIMKYKRR